MKCSHCQAENPQDSSFCNRCGTKLTFDFNVEMEDKSEAIIKEAIKKIQSEARIVENQTQADIQEKVVRWAKYQFIILSIVVIILGSLLTFFGYDEHSKFKKNYSSFDTKYNEFNKIYNVLVETTEKTLNKNKKLEDLQKEFIKTIDHEEEKLTKSRTDAETAIEKIKIELTTLQNQFFNIFFHFEGTDDQLNKIIPSVNKGLNSKGFLIFDDLYARVGVDKTEVIYYNEIVDVQAKRIADIIKELFPNKFHEIKHRLIRSWEKHPRTILIKLKCSNSKNS